MTTREAVAYLNERLDSPITPKVMHGLKALGRGPVVETRGHRLAYRREALDAFLTESGTDPRRWNDGFSRNVIESLRERGVHDAQIESLVRGLDREAGQVLFVDDIVRGEA